MSITFGTIISDWQLVVRMLGTFVFVAFSALKKDVHFVLVAERHQRPFRNYFYIYNLQKVGFISLALGMFISLLFGFIFGLILGTTQMPWGFGDFPTEEMKARYGSFAGQSSRGTHENTKMLNKACSRSFVLSGLRCMQADPQNKDKWCFVYIFRGNARSLVSFRVKILFPGNSLNFFVCANASSVDGSFVGIDIWNRSGGCVAAGQRGPFNRSGHQCLAAAAGCELRESTKNYLGLVGHAMWWKTLFQ